MKYIDEIKLKGKRFKVYKINKHEIYIFKKVHLEILKNTSKEFDSPYDYRDLKQNFQKESPIFLVYYKNKPIAYTLIYVFKDDCKFKKDFKKFCKISKKDIELTAELAGSGVLEGFRGLGLQSYFINLREEYLKKINFKFSVISVHPENKFSVNNIKKNNYDLVSFVKRKVKSRFYFKKNLSLN